VQLTQYDYQFGYFTKDADFYLRHESLQQPNFELFGGYGLGRLVANVVYRRGDHTVGKEVSFNKIGNVSLVVAASTKFGDHSLKGRLNLLEQAVAVSLKGKLNSRFSYVLALDSKQPNGLLPLPLGITLEATL